MRPHNRSLAPPRYRLYAGADLNVRMRMRPGWRP
jgi:hypothetical protein